MDVCFPAGTAAMDATTLRALYPPPRYLPIRDHLDRRSQHFIAQSRLLIIGSTRAGNGIDLSPRGGPPGFVHVPDAHTLIIPDRVGNNRLDTMHNLLAERQVGLFFLVQGLAETLRVKGIAHLEHDRQFSEADTVHEPARLAIVVSVLSAFIHCGRALRHARLWDVGWPAFGQAGSPASDP